MLWVDDHGSLIEGTVDLTFTENGRLVVVDFKTDRDPLEDAPGMLGRSGEIDHYRKQVRIYCRALAAAGQAVRAVLLRV